MVKLFSREVHHCFAALFDDTLRAFCAHQPPKLAEPRFGVVELPRHGRRQPSRHILDYID
jgi:hypothetical protein